MKDETANFIKVLFLTILFFYSGVKLHKGYKENKIDL